MALFRRFGNFKLGNSLRQINQQTKRNITRDADNYMEGTEKWVALPFVGMFVLIEAYTSWWSIRTKHKIEETRIALSPLSTRERDPDMKWLSPTVNKGFWTQHTADKWFVKEGGRDM